MSWSGRRQMIYLSVVLVVAAGILLLFVWPLLHKSPTCFDSKKNGDEHGVDCGGSCRLYCKEEVTPLQVQWSRAFSVVPGRYNVAAYVVNQNPSAGIYELSYTFELFDANNDFIASREGKTYIRNSGPTLVFEPGLMTGNRVPRFTHLKFSDPVWYSVAPELAKLPFFVSGNSDISTPDVAPSMQVVAQNPSYQAYKDVKVSVVIYNSEGNAIDASQTKVDFFDRTSRQNLFFSWLKPFDTPVARKEILFSVSPFVP